MASSKKKKKEEYKSSFYDWADKQYSKGTIYEKEDEEEIAPVKSTGSSFYDWADKQYAEVGEKEKESALAWRTDEIAPVKETEEKKKWYQGWLDKGAFEDGSDGFWDFLGNLGQTVVGTVHDVSENVTTAVFDATENLIDTTAYGIGAVGSIFDKDFDDKVGKFIAKEILKPEESGKFVADYFTPDGWANLLLNGGDTESASVLGDKADGLVQSGAHMAGSMALQMVGVPMWLTMGVNAFGSETESALQNDATFTEAGISGAVSTVAEIVFERISGGIKFKGMGTLDDGLTNWLKNNITNKVGRAISKYAVDVVGEGTEEVLTEYATAIGKKLTYMDDEEFNEIISTEDALDAFIGGAVMGGAFGGGKMVKSAKTGRDFVTGLTTNEEKVVKKVYEDEIAKRSVDGTDLKASERSKLWDDIVKKMNRGYIDTDTIESVLGGESYESYKSAFDSENALIEQAKALKDEYKGLSGKRWDDLTIEEQDRVNELRKLRPELQAKINESKKSGNTNQLKSQLSKSVFDMVKGKDRLVESYNEKARAEQDYVADFDRFKGTKHEDAARKTIENAIKAGANNTNAVHDIVDMAAELSSETGYVYDFKDGDQIKQDFIERKTQEIAKLEAIENPTEAQTKKLTALKDLVAKVQSGEVTVNGNVDSNGIVLNLDSAKPLNRIVGHEITHTVEKAKHYNKLRDSLFAYAKSKGVDIDAELAMKELEYEGVKGTTAEAELVADLVGDYLFTDSDFVRQLTTDNRNVAQRIYDEIKYFLTKATQGSKEERELLRVKHEFEKAFRETAEISEMSDSDVKHSLRTNPPPKETGVAYKVFFVKDGKLYPPMVANPDGEDTPMVANPDGEDTPMGVWLDADVGTSAPPSKTGRAQVKAGGKGTQGGSGSLAFRPGWHLGDLPRASQFDRVNPETGKKELFPENFVWAEVEYAKDVDYQEEAMSYGYTDKGKFRHAYAGLPRLPENGYYRYRTNPKPDTVPWIITGAMKVNRLLSDAEVNEILEKNGVAAVHRQGGDVGLDKFGFGEDGTVKYSLSKDSDGNQLSKGQRDYFKNSKVVDENGNLKVMYHGASEGGFHEFNPYMSDDRSSLFFVDSNNVAKSYSGTYEEYSAKTLNTAEDVNNLFAEINETDCEVREENGQFVLYDDGDNVAESDSAKGIFEEYRDYTGNGYGSANYKVYLNIQNPLVVDAKNAEWNSLANYNPNTMTGYEYIMATRNRDGSFNVEWQDKANQYGESETAYEMSLDEIKGKFGSYVSERINTAERIQTVLDNVIVDKNTLELIPNNTRQYSYLAKKQGYDGLVFNNIVDNGGFANGADTDISSTVAVAFDPEQVKSVANTKPTANADIRFSLSSNVESTKDLVAVHNMRVSELEKSLALGGLPMPSIAIIKAQSGHSEYGDVSLVFKKTAIDPQLSKDNKVYGGDAWTPTYPTIEYKANEKVAEKISKLYYDFAREHGYDEAKPLYNAAQDLEDELNRYKGEAGLIDAYKDDTRLMNFYLRHSGKGKIDPIETEIRTEMSDSQIQMNEYFINELGADVVADVMTPDGESPATHRKQYWAEHGEKVKEAYGKYLTQEFGFSAEEVENVLSKTNTFNLMKLVRDAYVYSVNGSVTVKTEVDNAATDEAIRQKAEDGYTDWIDSLFKGSEEKSGIRNNVDYFTPMGNRRSFEALHWENNLENVVRVMKQQDETGGGALISGFGIFGVSAKNYKSIDDIKADSDRLTHMPEDEYKEIRKGFSARLNEICESIMDKTERNQFIALDNACECVVDAIRTSKTKSGILKNLKQYSQLDVTEAAVDDIVSLVSDIANMPTEYFEAKPRRAVGFNEVATAIIPDNTSAELKQTLTDNGIPFVEYESGNEQARLDALNSLEDVKFSLSKANEDVAPTGNYDFYGKDFRVRSSNEDIAPMQADIEEIAPTTDADMFRDDYSPVFEQEISEMDRKAYLDSIDDSDVPPVAKQYGDNLNDSISIDSKSLKQLSNTISKSLELNRAARKELEKVMQDFSQDEFKTREALFDVIYEKFGTQNEELWHEDIATAKDYIRTHGIFVSPVEKSEFGSARDYADWMRRHFGKIKFSNSGVSVDTFYEDLQELQSGLFPTDIADSQGRLMRIAEVADMSAKELVPTRLPDEKLLEATNMIYDSIAEYHATERMVASEETGVNWDDFAPMPDETSSITVEESNSTQNAKAVKEEKKTTRQKLHSQIIDGFKSVFKGKGYNLDEVLKKAKNLSTFSTVDNIPQRVMEKALGYKEGQILADLTVNKVAQNETEGIKWLNSFTDRKNGLLAQISKQYNIKAGSKESAAAQMYAEGFYVTDDNDIVEYGDAELAQDFPNADVRSNIKRLAQDPRIRQVYDETLAAINESRERNAYPSIPRLDNYFLHFRAMEDTFSRLGLPFNPNDIRAKDLPTDLNGVTADLKPGQPYFASAMHRKGKRTSFDLLGGLERYLTAAKNQIYHIDDIQNLRALRNYIADTYGQANGLEGIDALTEEEAQERIEQVYGSHLSTFAKFLNEEANVLAGKTALIDRGLEGIIGRRGMTFFDSVNKQVGSNMVGMNISSSLTNFLPVAQTFAKTNKFDFLKAFTQTASNKIGSIFGKSDNFAENSPVIIRRKGADRFYRTPFQKVGDAGYVLMSAVDDISTELIARTKYNELTRNGMSEQQAHFETDKWVSRLMGDRSLGQMPQLYNSKMLGLVTKFQLEVRNQLDSQFYDTIQEAKVSNEDIENALARNAKTAAKVTSTFVQLAVAQNLFGMAFESVAGYNPAFDIISVLATMFGFDDDEESEDTALDNIEQGFLELLEDLPYTSTFTGGRIPISSALPISELIKGKDSYGNEKSRLETLSEAAPYYILPTGYGQIKKTMQGLGMFSDEHPVAGSYTDSGNLRFPVEDTIGNRIQAGIFGQYASKNAREYFDNGYAPLKEKQIQEYVDVELPIADYWKYREGLSGLKTTAEKADYINSLDIEDWQKNLLMNNILDRKEDVDMSNYDNYSSFEEFDYAEKNPEKYEFFKANGITYEDYANADEDGKAAYTWAYKNPEKYTLSKVIEADVVKYRSYTSDMNDIKADKDSNGKSISGSRKEKVLDYINNLDAAYETKILLLKTEYPSDDTYNAEIINYVNTLDELTYEERITIFTELGFTVSDGYVYWD